jgi:hypothetical protein
MNELHIVFNSSAAVDLRRALISAGREVEVVAGVDDLSFGPIDHVGDCTRAKWVEAVLGYSGWDAVEQRQERFWSEALSDRPERIVWVSRRSTQEFCGFLEWLNRNGEQPFKLVDLTDVMFLSNGDSGSLVLAPVTALIHDHQFSSARLWDLAAPAPPETQAEWLALWDRLRSENAPFRILSSAGLASAPLDVFDAQILSFIEDDWGKAALAVGHFLYASDYEGFCPEGVHQTSDMVAIARIAALIESGKIEGRGNPYELQTCTVRRRAPC